MPQPQKSTPKPRTAKESLVKYFDYEGERYELSPLKVALLRRFMRRFNDLANATGDDAVEYIDIVFDCSAIAMSKEFPEETKYVTKLYAGEEVTDEDREPWGNVVDMDDVALINEHRGGVNLATPNLPTETPTETPTAQK